MNALVSYASSDSEAESERPAKITKTEALAARSRADAATHSNVSTEGESDGRGGEEHSNKHPSQSSQSAQSTIPIGPSIPESSTATKLNTVGLESDDPSIAAAPAPAPEPEPETTTSTPPQSPYTTTRAAMHDLTLPTHPNFSIPESPSPPSSPDLLAAHAAATKKFAKFLELKHHQHHHDENERRRRDGGRGAAPMHFHERLLASSALRNPGMVDRLMEFAGVGVEERYAGTLPVGNPGSGLETGDGEDGEDFERGGVPVRWGEGWYVENLMREAERRRKKAERKKGEDVQFVPSNAGGTDGSNNLEPDIGGGRGKSVMSEHGQHRSAKKSRFDER